MKSRTHSFRENGPHFFEPITEGTRLGKSGQRRSLASGEDDAFLRDSVREAEKRPTRLIDQPHKSAIKRRPIHGPKAGRRKQELTARNARCPGQDLRS